METIIVGLILGALFVIISFVYSASKNKVSTYVNTNNLKVDPNNTKSLYKLGKKSFDESKHSEALVYFKKLYDINPYDFLGAFYLGSCYYILKDYTNAENVFKKIIDDNNVLKENNTSSLRNLFNIIEVDNAAFMFYVYGHLMHMKNDFKQAVHFKELAYKLDKKNVSSLNLY